MSRLVRTELLKQRTTRTVVLGVIAAPALAGLMTSAVFAAAGKQGNDPLGPDSLMPAIGAPAAAVTLVALFLGLLGMAGEYRHQTITTTFLASPRRYRVLLAKLAAHLVTGTAMGLSSVAVSTAVAVPWLRSQGVAIDIDGDLVSVAAGLVASTALYAVLGVAVAALLRNQTAAVAAVLVWLLAVEGLLSKVYADRAFVDWLPGAAGRALVHAGDGLSMPVAAAAFAAYVAGFALAAARLTLPRDVT